MLDCLGKKGAAMSAWIKPAKGQAGTRALASRKFGTLLGRRGHQG
jgi:hypothetical protein